MAQSGYAHGQGAKITEFFSNRSLGKEASFLRKHLLPGIRLLDIGCGPGSITCDFASLITDGHVVGVDLSPIAIENAQKLANDRKLSNIEFSTGDVTKGLSFKDGEFDVVFCHQVINHLRDPIGTLREMKRLTKSGGVVAVREILHVLFYPPNKHLDKFNYWHFKAIKNADIEEANVAERLPLNAQEAGFQAEKITSTVSGDTFFSEQQREYARRGAQTILGLDGTLRPNAIKAGATDEELDNQLAELDIWMKNKAAWMSALSIELICRK